MKEKIVRAKSVRTDKDVFNVLDTQCSNWQESDPESLLKQYWQIHGMQVNLKKSHTPNVKPAVSRRSSYFSFEIYEPPSPDRDLQLVIALVKSICGDYNDLSNISTGSAVCPSKIIETDFCTIVARKILFLMNK
jgi:hypothetical protein